MNAAFRVQITRVLLFAPPKSVIYVASVAAVFSVGVITLKCSAASGAYHLTGPFFIHFISVGIPPCHTAFVRAELLGLLFHALQ